MSDVCEVKSASPPPRLDLLSEFGHSDLQRSSTFRASLEKAVDDINNKYGTKSSNSLTEDTPEEYQVPSRAIRGHTLPSYAQASFRPRYKLPTFIKSPASCARSDTGELKELTPTVSVESVQMKTNPRDVLIPDHQIDQILGQVFGAKPAVECPAGDKTSRATEAAESNQEDNTHHMAPALSSDPTDHEGENRDVDISAKFETTKLETTETDSTRPVAPDDIHQNQPTADSASAKPNRGSIGRPRARTGGVESLPPLMDKQNNSLFESSVTMKRVRSGPGASGCSETVSKSRHTSDCSNDSQSQDANIPSVSDLVSKFRRMAAPNIAASNAVSAASKEPTSPMKKVARGKQFETFRSRFSNDSEDSGPMSYVSEGGDDYGAAGAEPASSPPDNYAAGND